MNADIIDILFAVMFLFFTVASYYSWRKWNEKIFLLTMVLGFVGVITNMINYGVNFFQASLFVRQSTHKILLLAMPVIAVLSFYIVFKNSKVKN